MQDFIGSKFTDDIADAVDGVVETVAAPSTNKLRKMFLKFTNNCSDHREDAFRDRRYYDGDQISAAWQKSLAENDMPMVPINLIQDNIAAHIGLISAQQTEVRAFSRTQAGAPAAEVATKLIRYAIDSGQVEVKFREGCEQFFIEGVGCLLIECDEAAIYVQIIDFRDLFFDPDSRRSDFSDAKWIGFSRWLRVSDVEAAYPEAFERISPTGDHSDFFSLAGSDFSKDTVDDAPAWTQGAESLRVIEMYYLEDGQWMHTVWCHKGVLDHGPSQYMTDRGLSRHPFAIEACNTMADRDAKNQRYGEVRKLVYPQDDYNSRRHLALKYMMAKTIQMVDSEAQPVDPDTLRAEAQKRIAIIPQGYQMQDTSVSAEQVQFMQMAGAEIQRLSPAAAVTGTNLPEDASGRSRQLAAAGGRLSLTPILSRVQDWRENVYRQVWYCINQYWHGQMEVRISGDVNAPKYLQINVPQIEEVDEPIVDPTSGQPMIDAYTGEVATQRVAKVIGVQNDVAQMDMDFKLVTTESHNSLEQEVWDALMKMMASLQIPFGTPEFRLALEWYPMPDKTDVIERYDAMLEKLKGENSEAQQMQQQMAEMQTQLKMLLDKNKADKDASTAQVNVAKAERTHLETAMLSDNHNQQQELAQIAAQQLFRG
jgi:hypothetical protein